MNLTIKKFFLAGIFILFAGTVLWSCKKDDAQPNKGVTELLSFGPTGAKVGDTIVFIGNNLDKVNAIQFSGNDAGIDKSGFLSQTDQLIRVKVPENTEKGFVTLTLSNGNSIVSKTQFNIGVLASISSISPMSVRPGEQVTLTGDFLNWVDRISFAKDLEVTEFDEQSKTKIVVTIPDEAQTGTIVFHYTGTDSAYVETTEILDIKLPVGETLSPDPLKHGDELSIVGTDLDLTRAIYFNGVSDAVTTFVSQSATEIVVKVPGATLDGPLELEAPSGLKTTTNQSISLLMPSISSLSPNPVGTGENITIAGSNLDLVSSVGISGVNDAVTAFVSQTASAIVLQVPDDAVKGKVTLNIKNSSLIVKSNEDLGIAGATVDPILLYTDGGISSVWNESGGWIGDGWGGTKDYNNKEQIRGGSSSIKIFYESGGWGAPFQLGSGALSLAGYDKLKISIYGSTDSDGKNIMLQFNGSGGKFISVEEGKWTDYEIPLGELISSDILTDFIIQNQNAEGAFTIYVDNVGFY